ncbi:PspC domain-containing protein [Gracilibacillus phocaeensis]|uniref:PspC domain-containing protein n=1 Tax=Gracilibacillus phocaeensis TaxID=2042304 RepID=UPI001030AEAA|nr:PspC domain-containing protein [Gracilibacillus phocaeensis]
MNRKLNKSVNDRVLLGVCGGIADFFGITPLPVRIIFLLTLGGSFWVYVVLAYVLDDAPTL